MNPESPKTPESRNEQIAEQSPAQLVSSEPIVAPAPDLEAIQQVRDRLKVAGSSAEMGAESAVSAPPSFNELVATEYARMTSAGTPREAKRLQGNFSKAVKAIEKGDLRRTERLLYPHDPGELIGAKIQELNAAGNVEAMKRLVRKNSVRSIGEANLTYLPKDIVQSADVQQKLKKEIEEGMTAPIVDTEARERTATIIRRLAGAGLLSREAASEFLGSSRFVQLVRKDVERAARRNGNLYPAPPEIKADKAIRSYIDAGLLSLEDANAIGKRWRRSF